MGWKEKLLSSGVPLEYSVQAALLALDPDRDVYEYKYERTDSVTGVPKPFSVDFTTSFHLEDPDFLITLLVECKYAHDGWRWVFTPHAGNVHYLAPSPSDLFMCLDGISRLSIDRRLLDDCSAMHPLCGKGVAVTDNNHDVQPIETARNQLSYAAIDVASRSLKAQASAPDTAAIIIPIVVTTAALWRMKENVTLEAIRAADELGDIAESFNSLILHESPNSELRRYSADALTSRLDSNDVANIQGLLETIVPHIKPATYFGALAISRPSMFLVVNYESFRPTVERLVWSLRQEGLVRQRAPIDPALANTPEVAPPA